MQAVAPADGAVGKRCTSSSASSFGPDAADHDPAAGRPEVDRRSTVSRVAASLSQEGRRDAGVDGDVQARS